MNNEEEPLVEVEREPDGGRVYKFSELGSKLFLVALVVFGWTLRACFAG